MYQKNTDKRLVCACIHAVYLSHGNFVDCCRVYMYVIKAIDRWCWSGFVFTVWEMELYFLTCGCDQNVRQLCGRVCMYLAIYLKEFWAYQTKSFYIMLFLSLTPRASHDSSRTWCVLCLYWCFWVEPRWWWVITFQSKKIISLPEVFVIIIILFFFALSTSGWRNPISYHEMAQ